MVLTTTQEVGFYRSHMTLSSPSTRRVYATRVDVSTPDGLAALAAAHNCMIIGPLGLKADVGQMLDKLASGELVITER